MATTTTPAPTTTKKPDDTETKTGYCVPVDETNPDIEKTANLEVPLEGKYSTNSANNSLIRTVLNFTAFIVIIGLVAITMPYIYSMFIMDMIKNAVELGVNNAAIGSLNGNDQQKVLALGGADILSVLSISLIAIFLIIDGVTNRTNGALFGIFLFILLIIAFARVQLMKMDEGNFLEQLTGTKNLTFSGIQGLTIGAKMGAAFNNFTYLFSKGSTAQLMYGLAIFFSLFITWMLLISLGLGLTPSGIALYTFIGFPIIMYISILFKYLISTYMK